MTTTNDRATDKLSDQLATHIQKQFTGRLDIQGVKTWSLYFCLGRLVWAAGGTHPLRRWYRHLSQYFPQISPNDFRLREGDVGEYWEYQVLIVLAKRQKISGEHAVAVIRNVVSEVLFEILQQEQKAPLTFISRQQDVLDASLTLINTEKALKESQLAWENWQKAGLTNLSPNMAPIVKEAEELKQLASPKVYETLVKLVNGKRTLRDLAIQLKQDLLLLTRSLLPYIRKKVIGLVEIPDLPKPSAPATTQPPQNVKTEVTAAPSVPAQPAVKPAPSVRPLPPPPATSGLSTRPLIAYVEDSLHDCQIMEEILSKASYGFVSIKDSMQALPMLLQHKPDLIFLDLVMPVANGYEICAQIRRISSFKNTPVIILTGNDGIVDRVRAKIVGASDFLAKPIGDQKVLTAIRKHLNSSSLPQDTPQSLTYKAS